MANCDGRLTMVHCVDRKTKLAVRPLGTECKSLSTQITVKITSRHICLSKNADGDLPLSSFAYRICRKTPLLDTSW